MATEAARAVKSTDALTPPRYRQPRVTDENRRAGDAPTSPAPGDHSSPSTTGVTYERHGRADRSDRRRQAPEACDRQAVSASRRRREAQADVVRVDRGGKASRRPRDDDGDRPLGPG